MAEKLDVKQGTLALMILGTLEALGPLHGYGVARRIERWYRRYRQRGEANSRMEAWLDKVMVERTCPEWRQSENNRRAKFYSLTAAGRRQLAREAREWHRTADLIAAFLAPRRGAP